MPTPASAPSARALAADLVNAVLLDGRSLTAALAQRRAGSALREVAAAQDLAYGTLRRLGLLRFLLERLLKRPLTPPELRGGLLVALHELTATDTPAYAIVNEAVALAARRAPGARGFVNAVLRTFLRERPSLEAAAVKSPEAQWNFPAWWIDRLAAAYPAHWQAVLAAQNAHPPMTLRVNRRLCSRDDYRARLDAAGIAAQPVGPEALALATPLPVEQLPGFASGEVSVQDLGAQYAAGLLDVADGMRVLDACAAPGGKTAHLLEGHALDVTALDIDAGRLARVEAGLARLGVSAKLLQGDAGRPGDWWDDQPFERILLDAPCTASGVVRRHPDGKWLKRPEDASALAKVQAALLDALWPLLKPAGKLLYATCSVFDVENAAQAMAFLARHPDAQLEPLALPNAVAPGQLLPNALHDGFFYARFVKT